MTTEKLTPFEIHQAVGTIDLEKLGNQTDSSEARRETEQYLRRLGQTQREEHISHEERVRTRKEYFNSLLPELGTWLQEKLPDGRIRSAVFLSEGLKSVGVTRKPSRGMAEHIRREKAKRRK